jgi:hypothetical protein
MNLEKKKGDGVDSTNCPQLVSTIRRQSVPLQVVRSTTLLRIYRQTVDIYRHWN